MTQFSAPTTLCGSPHRLARLSLCLALAACANEGLESASATTNNGTTTEDATSDTSGDAPCLADEARAILATHCATCHRPDGIGAKAFADPEDLEALVGRGLVIAGAPDDSPLYTLLVNGAMLDEPYLDRTIDYGHIGPLVMAPDFFYVMGDNRGNSSDSRLHGPLPREQILGKAWVSYWPLANLGLISDSTSYAAER